MALLLDIGGLGVVVDAPAVVREAVARRYGPFVVGALPAGAPLALEVTPAARFAPALERPEEVRASVDGGELRLDGPIEATFSPAARRCRVVGARGLGAVDAALRLGLGVLLPLDGALLLHAGLGRSFVFAGASGAGKSTAARALGGPCDELVVVRPDGEGAVAHATPYWGGRRASLRLDGVVVLSRAGAGAPAFAAHEGAAGLRLLWPHLVRHVALAQVEAASLAAAAALCRRLPVFDCRCPEGEAFLPWLTAALSARRAA